MPTPNVTAKWATLSNSSISDADYAAVVAQLAPLQDRAARCVMGSAIQQHCSALMHGILDAALAANP